MVRVPAVPVRARRRPRPEFTGRLAVLSLRTRGAVFRRGDMAMIAGPRGSGLNLLCAVGLVFAGMLFSAPPAAADDAESCQKESGDVAIAACSRAIASGQYKDRGLATLYYNRGTNYMYKGQHDRAIQDYDQTIRLN